MDILYYPGITSTLQSSHPINPSDPLAIPTTPPIPQKTCECCQITLATLTLLLCKDNWKTDEENWSGFHFIRYNMHNFTTFYTFAQHLLVGQARTKIAVPYPDVVCVFLI